MGVPIPNHPTAAVEKDQGGQHMIRRATSRPVLTHRQLAASI
jgi:hypothetical protein